MKRLFSMLAVLPLFVMFANGQQSPAVTRSPSMHSVAAKRHHAKRHRPQHKVAKHHRQTRHMV